MPRTAQPGTGSFSYAQLEGLWVNAGGPKRLAPLMAAIAEAESGGNPVARNPSGATGLWQILGNPFPGDATNPETNARMAVAKWQSQGLTAWTTYSSGAYRQFLKRGVKPVVPAMASGYANPFRAVQGLKAGRVDQGVDYGGSGPVYALGPGTITYAGTGNTGWGPPAGITPGGYIKERLSSGPLAGHDVYVAEGVVPTVRPGQKVTSATQIGTLTGGGIETGFAAPGAGTVALGASQFTGGNVTAAGDAFSQILHALGAPAGIEASKPTGHNPSWLDQTLHDLGSFISNLNPLTPITDVAGAIGALAQPFITLGNAIDWLLQPSHWVRIIAGVGGGFLVGAGLWNLAHVGGSASKINLAGVSVPVSFGGSAALPFGVAEVGLGAMLLFVAFHNLPSSVTGPPELLAYLRDAFQGQGQLGTPGTAGADAFASGVGSGAVNIGNAIGAGQ